MSVQLATYLRLRADGASVEEAAEQSGIGLTEARFTEQAITKGELSLPEPSTKESAMPKNDEPNAEPITELAADTLRGDLRDAMLSWFKSTPKAWSQMGEREQSDIADAADRCARQLVKQTCQIIAASERPCIVAQLVEYKEKDGVEAKLKLPSKGEVVAALHEACGREVLIVTSGEEEFQGEAAPAEIEKDQPELGIGAEYEEAA
jgi:hypothetical protein